MRIKHIIWDWNGTLLDDVWLSVESINKVLSKRQMPTLTENRYKSLFGFPVKDYYERIGFDFVKESFEIVGTEFIEEYDKHHLKPSLHHNAHQTIDTLIEKGISNSVLSARKMQQLSEELSHYKISDRLTGYSGLDHHYATSKLENGKQMLKEIGLKPSEMLFIGDTTHDHEVATALGMKCVLLDQGHQTKSVLLKTDAYIISDLKSILTLI